MGQRSPIRPSFTVEVSKLRYLLPECWLERITVSLIRSYDVQGVTWPEREPHLVI
jgi:hypothetical protein